MDINTYKLYIELVSAGIEISGCDTNGNVLDLDNKKIQDRAEVKAIIKAHDPTPVPVETEEEKIRRIVKENFIITEKEK